MAKRVLVVDDEVCITSVLTRIIASWGYDAASFSDVRSCISALPCTGACAFDSPCAHAIITDLHMPGVSGLDLVELLRARNCKIPRIAIMSADCGEFLLRAAHTGCDFFEKPLDLTDLSSWLSSGEGERTTMARIGTRVWQ